MILPPPPPQILLIFLLRTSPEWSSQGSGKVPKKLKNLKLIKMAQKRKRAQRKCHTSFFAFHLLDLKIVPNYSELNSAPENQTHLFLKSGCGT